MGNISFTNIADGTQIDASDVNTPLKTIYDEFNGSVDSNNIADDAVITAKIADDAVITAKIADDAVTVDKLSNPYKFRVTRTSNQTGITDSAYVKIQFNSETYDTNNNFDTSTYKYTVPVTGYYDLKVMVKATGAGITTLGLQILKNSAVLLLKNIDDFPSVNDASLSMNDLIYLTATDTVYVEVYINVASSTGTIIGSATELFFSGFLQSV